MPIPEDFDVRVAANVLEGNVWLAKGKVSTDSTRRDLVAFIRDNSGQIGPIIEDLLSIGLRLEKIMKIIDPDGGARRILQDGELKKLLLNGRPAEIFDILVRQSPEKAFAFRRAQELGFGHREILQYALDRAAEEAGCQKDIAAISADLRPKVEVKVEAEMNVSVAERMERGER